MADLSTAIIYTNVMGSGKGLALLKVVSILFLFSFVAGLHPKLAFLNTWAIFLGVGVIVALISTGDRRLLH